MNKTNPNLENIILIIKPYGLKVLPEETNEIKKEKAEDFLATLYNDLREKISERRKKGHDLFMAGLKIMQLSSKLKIALSTFEKKDIEKYLLMYKNIKKEVEQIILPEKEEEEETKRLPLNKTPQNK